MKKNTIFLLYLLLYSNLLVAQSKNQQKFYFVKEEFTSRKGFEQMNKLLDSLTNGKRKTDFTSFHNLLNHKDSIILKNTDDSYLRYEYERGQVMNLIKVNRNNGILTFFGDLELKQVRNEFDLFTKYKNVDFKINKGDKKSILGFKCFKVIVSFKEEEDYGLDLGKTIYEMYVTKKIKHPVHSIVYVPKLLNDFFPLEVIRYEEKLVGSKTLYKIYKIEN